MIVYATVRVDLSTAAVDAHTSIPAAVADVLMVEESSLVDPEEWMWVYTSSDEYDWATARENAGISPFTGQPFGDEGDDA